MMMPYTRILRLNKSGMPLGWLSTEDAATLLVKGHVLWSMGEHSVVLRGGYRSDGSQSLLEIPSIIASSGDLHHYKYIPPKVSNQLLFRRDRNICLYCGVQFLERELTRDHIIPRWQGGIDKWTNVATACRRCNQRKGGRTPEEARMPLLAVPFTPNKMEMLVLANRNILADQMEFLQAGFSRNMRLQ